MCEKRVQQVQSVEQELSWLKDLGLSNEEKIILLEFMLPKVHPDEQQVIRDAIDTLIIEKILLGKEDEW